MKRLIKAEYGLFICRLFGIADVKEQDITGRDREKSEDEWRYRK